MCKFQIKPNYFPKYDGKLQKHIKQGIISFYILKRLLWLLWRKEAGNQIGCFDHVLGEDNNGLKWSGSTGGDKKCEICIIL